MQRACAGPSLGAFMYMHSLAAVQRPHVPLMRSSAGCLMPGGVLYAAQGVAFYMQRGPVGRRFGISAGGPLRALRGRSGRMAGRMGRVSAQFPLVLPIEPPRPDAGDRMRRRGLSWPHGAFRTRRRPGTTSNCRNLSKTAPPKNCTRLCWQRRSLRFSVGWKGG